MATIFERVKRIIVEQLGVKDEEVTPKSSFIEDFNADSLDLVELMMAAVDYITDLGGADE